MAKLKLTARSVAGLETGTYYDSDLTGFGLRVGAHGATWFVEYRPGAGGRGVAKKRTKIGRLDHLPPDEARRAASKILAGVSLGSDPAKAKAEERASLPFSAVAQNYLDQHVKSKRKAATEDSYERIIRLHLNPYIGNKKIGAVIRSDVLAMHSAVGKTGGRYVANRALALVSAIFSWADPDTPNPARKIERFKEQGRDRYLSDEEIIRLGDALREAETVGLPYDVDPDKPNAKHAPKPENRRVVLSPHVTAAIRLLILTGARLREILHLRWDEFDDTRGLLRLPDSKTGKKVIVLSDAALAVLREVPRLGAFVIAGRNAGEDGEQPRADLKRPWEAISKRAGLEGVVLHDLRHSFASVGVDAGMSLPVIGGLLGHKSSITTAKYAHIDTSPARRAANTIAGKIGAALNGKK